MPSESVPAEILVVEDSPTQALHLQRLFQMHEFRTRVARNGREALAALGMRLPALIVSDVVMPEMDGYELCRRIKADPKTRSIPVLLLTALCDPQDIILGLNCGADNFLVKPWDEKTLLARVRHMLANCELRGGGAAQFGIEVVFHGQKHLIHSDRLQILDLLLASYEIATERTAELQRAKEEAERANRAKTELLGRVAHEMRTPLNAILGFGQLLQLESLGEEHDESVRHILEGGEDLLRLTTEMIDLSRIESGTLNLSCEVVQWETAVRKCLDMIQPIAETRALKIRWDRRKVDRRVVADPDRLEEVLRNLISNAVKYNRDGGTVTISDRHLPDGNLRISIEDTGYGIPEENLSLLFVPFERMGAEKRGIEGAGLGLALSRRLAEAMGGTIGVESRVGFGSTFWLDLPTQRQRVAPPSISGRQAGM